MNSTVPALRYFTWWAILRALRCRACRTLSSSPYAGASSTTCHKLLCYCNVGAKVMHDAPTSGCHVQIGDIGAAVISQMARSQAGQGRAGQGRAGQGRAGRGRAVQSMQGKAIAKECKCKADTTETRASKGTKGHQMASRIVSMLTPYIMPVGLLTLRHAALSSEDSNHTIPDSKA